MKFSLNQTRKNFLPLVFLVSVILLLILGYLILNRLFSSKSTIEAPDFQTTKKISPINLNSSTLESAFSDNNIITPDSYQVYSLEATVLPPTTLLEKIKQLNKELKPSQVKYVWISDNEQQQLTYNQFDDYYRYIDLSIIDKGKNTFSRQETIVNTITTATTFVNSFFDTNSYTPDIENLSYYNKGDEHAEEEKPSPENSDVIEIPFSLTETHPTYVNESLLYPLYVSFDANGNLYGFKVISRIYEKTSSESVSSVTLDQVQGKIDTGDFLVVRSYSESGYEWDQESIANIKIVSVDLEYHLDETSQRLIPYYRILANVELYTSETPVKFDLLVTAVNTTN